MQLLNALRSEFSYTCFGNAAIIFYAATDTRHKVKADDISLNALFVALVGKHTRRCDGSSFVSTELNYIKIL